MSRAHPQLQSYANSSYAGRAVIPHAPSLEPTLASQDSHLPRPRTLQGMPRRDSFVSSALPPVQSYVQPILPDPVMVPAASQPLVQPVRRDSTSSVPHPPPRSILRNSILGVALPPVPVLRATDPLPAVNPGPPAPESAPRGQGTLVPTRVRFADENLTFPSIPTHKRRKGWYNRRGYASRPFPPLP
jgi:hypothetical protein